MIARLKAATRHADALRFEDILGVALLFAVLFVALAVPVSI